MPRTFGQPIHAATEWGRTLNPRIPGATLEHVAPALYVIIHHEGGSDPNSPWVDIMRRLQTDAFNHIEPSAPQGHIAIDYSFAAGPAWKAEGRGWGIRGSHTGNPVPNGWPQAGASLNVVGRGIVVPGNTLNYPVPDTCVQAIAELIAEGVAVGDLSPQFIVTDHRTVWNGGTACPGSLHDRLGDINVRARQLLAGGPHMPQLAAPIIDVVVTPSGNGYWQIASDGGVFAFGDALPFAHNPYPAQHLGGEVNAAACTGTGRGLWLNGADGAILTLGDAPFHGSASQKLSPAPGTPADPTP